MKSKNCATGAAFRRALEDRLKGTSKNEDVDPQRLRRQVAFDRLLARLFHAGKPSTAALARECQLSPDLGEAFGILKEFIRSHVLR